MRAVTHVHNLQARQYVPGSVADLLNLLRDEAVGLLEHQLPADAELRPLVGALVSRLERLEKDVVGELKPAPEPAPVVQPSVANQVQPGALVPSPPEVPGEPETPAPEPSGASEPGPDANAGTVQDPRDAEIEQLKAKLAEHGLVS